MRLIFEDAIDFTIEFCILKIPKG